MKYSEIYLEDNYLKENFSEYLKKENLDSILKLKKENAKILDYPSIERFSKPIEEIPNIKTSLFDYSSSKSIIIGDRKEISFEDYKKIINGLKALIPWRIGPFEYFGVFIDSEWNSFIKYSIIKDYLDVKDKIVGDIGTNNGYFMFKLLNHNPSFIIGFDVLDRYFFYYYLNKKFIKLNNIKFELISVDNIDLFENFFDYLLFMGVLYHRRNPVDTVVKINKALKKGGRVLVESMVIDEYEESVFLFPESRFMKAINVWFIPSKKALINIFERNGFKLEEIIGVFPHSVNEQRNTPWVNTQSLRDFINPKDPTKTIEGYPLPKRMYALFRKKK